MTLEVEDVQTSHRGTRSTPLNQHLKDKWKKKQMHHILKNHKGKSYMESLDCRFQKRRPKQYFTEDINHAALKKKMTFSGAGSCCERSEPAMFCLIGWIPQLWTEKSHHNRSWILQIDDGQQTEARGQKQRVKHVSRVSDWFQGSCCMFGCLMDDFILGTVQWFNCFLLPAFSTKRYLPSLNSTQAQLETVGDIVNNKSYSQSILRWKKCRED